MPRKTILVVAVGVHGVWGQKTKCFEDIFKCHRNFLDYFFTMCPRKVFIINNKLHLGLSTVCKLCNSALELTFCTYWCSINLHVVVCVENRIRLCRVALPADRLRHGTLFTVTPDNSTWKIRLGRRVKVLQKMYTERRLSGPHRSSYNTGKRMFKPDVTGHECPLSALTPHIYTRLEEMYYHSSAFASKRILCKSFPRADIKYLLLLYPFCV